MFVAGKRPTPCKPERGDDTQGNELFLWAWGCRVSVSMHVCVSVLCRQHVLFPWAFLHLLGCSWAWRCPPLQHHVFLQGGKLLALSMEKGASGSRPGGESIGVSPVSPACHCPRVFGFGFVAGGLRQHMVKHSAPDQARVPPKGTLLSWSHCGLL